MKCLYCTNIVESTSPRAKEKICNSCTSIDGIRNNDQIILAKECLERVRAKHEKIQV